MNIAVYGFMGVGKTTVGMLLANKLGYEFVDMDMQIEKNEGASIKEIFQKHGEPKFRKLESKLVEKLSQRDRLVISCGGGVVANTINAEVLKSTSKMVYLTATIDEILRRSSSDNSRPLLNVKNQKEQASKLYEARRPVYSRYADITIDTTSKTPDEVIDAILEEL